LFFFLRCVVRSAELENRRKMEVVFLSFGKVDTRLVEGCQKGIHDLLEDRQVGITLSVSLVSDSSCKRLVRFSVRPAEGDNLRVWSLDGRETRCSLGYNDNLVAS